MSSLAKLSDVLLVDTYTKAVAIQVDPDFIHYLIVEIRRRGLDLVIEEKNKLEMSVQ
ncbi:sporulation histidine kinase inhibitor Sda [Cytobacillus dafuensis]|uniref:Sporulation histidine kinase inhibitor Sda n=1 Tax=Cytobacillus dafuensis TaxID=1742359 RepID=A0A5B8ZBH7_CYTDA|nr:sporulation histidine kinase inhibitor Sda [Cytobacillus dafuensis]QED49613.1 sporulation histidine kinase inhibitor Sda [Cytobacillus dafuensis]